MKKLLLVIAIFALVSFKPPDKKVLIIGDSISIGYFPFVKDELKDIATVDHHKGNGQNTFNGLKNLKNWLGDTQWDVIQFNFGLWDLCYRSEHSTLQGKQDKLNGKPDTTPMQYRKNLQKIVALLEQTGAKLIFVSTTYVPEGEPGRFTKDVPLYNKIALEVMKAHHIQVNDIYKKSKKIVSKYPLKPENVHYSTEGYQLISQLILKDLKQAIKP